MRAATTCADNDIMKSYVTIRKKQNGSTQLKSSSNPDVICTTAISKLITVSSLRDIFKQELSITI